MLAASGAGNRPARFRSSRPVASCSPEGRPPIAIRTNPKKISSRVDPFVISGIGLTHASVHSARRPVARADALFR